ncbi:hypothetical protein [Streptomyces sp. NPDC059649]|uniref:hypothetical protein n=1 Tax=Streptomyces sp. NPDC059649 TaxID=3346895 RepID=UPI0036AC3E5D
MRLFASRKTRRHSNPEAELAKVQAENAYLRRELAEVQGKYLRTLESIDRSVGDRAELAERYATATQRQFEAELIVKCVSDENTRLKADNERLQRQLAAATKPIARVIPLQNRGPEAA